MIEMDRSKYEQAKALQQKYSNPVLRIGMTEEDIKKLGGINKYVEEFEKAEYQRKHQVGLKIAAGQVVDTQKRFGKLEKKEQPEQPSTERKKGRGWLGEIKTGDGRVMTELSVGVEIDGKETEIPLLVPSLSPEEIDHLKTGKMPTRDIIDKAVDHAQQQIGQGKSPFYEEPTEEISETSGRILGTYSPGTGIKLGERFDMSEAERTLQKLSPYAYSQIEQYKGSVADYNGLVLQQIEYEEQKVIENYFKKYIPERDEFAKEHGIEPELVNIAWDKIINGEDISKDETLMMRLNESGMPILTTPEEIHKQQLIADEKYSDMMAMDAFIAPFANEPMNVINDWIDLGMTLANSGSKLLGGKTFSKQELVKLRKSIMTGGEPHENYLQPVRDIFGNDNIDIDSPEYILVAPVYARVNEMISNRLREEYPGSTEWGSAGAQMARFITEISLLGGVTGIGNSAILFPLHNALKNADPVISGEKNVVEYAIGIGSSALIGLAYRAAGEIFSSTKLAEKAAERVYKTAHKQRIEDVRFKKIHKGKDQVEFVKEIYTRGLNTEEVLALARHSARASQIPLQAAGRGLVGGSFQMADNIINEKPIFDNVPEGAARLAALSLVFGISGLIDAKDLQKMPALTSKQRDWAIKTARDVLYDEATKSMIIKEGLKQPVKIDWAAFREYYGVGMENQNIVSQFFKDAGMDGREIGKIGKALRKGAILNGEIETGALIKVVDKPYWGAIKKFFNVKPTDIILQKVEPRATWTITQDGKINESGAQVMMPVKEQPKGVMGLLPAPPDEAKTQKEYGQRVIRSLEGAANEYNETGDLQVLKKKLDAFEGNKKDILGKSGIDRDVIEGYYNQLKEFVSKAEKPEPKPEKELISTVEDIARLFGVEVKRGEEGGRAARGVIQITESKEPTIAVAQSYWGDKKDIRAGIEVPQDVEQAIHESLHTAFMRSPETGHAAIDKLKEIGAENAFEDLINLSTVYLIDPDAKMPEQVKKIVSGWVTEILTSAEKASEDKTPVEKRRLMTRGEFLQKERQLEREADEQDRLDNEIISLYDDEKLSTDVIAKRLELSEKEVKDRLDAYRREIMAGDDVSDVDKYTAEERYDLMLKEIKEGRKTEKEIIEMHPEFAVEAEAQTDKDRKAILVRIDTALARMRAKGHGDTAYYRNLKNKRNKIAEGADYAVRDVTESVGRAVFSLIPRVNMGFDGTLIPPRGKIISTEEGIKIIDKITSLIEESKTVPPEMQPWTLTREQFLAQYPLTKWTELGKEHEKAVEQAAKKGDAVPIGVLQDYKGKLWADEALNKIVSDQLGKLTDPIKELNDQKEKEIDAAILGDEYKEIKKVMETEIPDLDEELDHTQIVFTQDTLHSFPIAWGINLHIKANDGKNTRYVTITKTSALFKIEEAVDYDTGAIAIYKGKILTTDEIIKYQEIEEKYEELIDRTEEMLGTEKKPESTTQKDNELKNKLIQQVIDTFQNREKSVTTKFVGETDENFVFSVSAKSRHPVDRLKAMLKNKRNIKVELTGNATDILVNVGKKELMETAERLEKEKTPPERPKHELTREEYVDLYGDQYGRIGARLRKLEGVEEAWHTDERGVAVYDAVQQGLDVPLHVLKDFEGMEWADKEIARLEKDYPKIPKKDTELVTEAEIKERLESIDRQLDEITNLKRSPYPDVNEKRDKKINKLNERKDILMGRLPRAKDELPALWEMTKKEAESLANEVVSIEEIHRRRISSIKQALSDDKSVPLNVLRDYTGQPWADKEIARLEKEMDEAIGRPDDGEPVKIPISDLSKVGLDRLNAVEAGKKIKLRWGDDFEANAWKEGDTYYVTESKDGKALGSPFDTQNVEEFLGKIYGLGQPEDYRIAVELKKPEKLEHKLATETEGDNENVRRLKQLENDTHGKLPIPQNVKDRINVEGISGELRIPSISVKITRKTTDLALTPILDRVINQPIKRVIYYDADKQNKVATDMTMLAVFPTDEHIEKSKMIDMVTYAELDVENKDLEYPSYMRFLEKTKDWKYHAEIGDGRQLLEQAAALVRAEKFLAENNKPFVELNAILFLNGKPYLFSPQKIYKAIKILKELGIDDISIAAEGDSENAVIFYESGNFNNLNNLVLLMPMRNESVKGKTPNLDRILWGSLGSYDMIDIKKIKPSGKLPSYPIEDARKPSEQERLDHARYKLSQAIIEAMGYNFTPLENLIENIPKAFDLNTNPLAKQILDEAIENLNNFTELAGDIKKKPHIEKKMPEELKPETEKKGIAALSNHLVDKILAGEVTDNPKLDKIVSEFLGGTKAAGVYTSQDAYNALELAINKILMEHDPPLLKMDRGEALAFISDLMGKIPTQVSRTQDKINLQQFSTPPHIAFAAAIALMPQEDDVGLEPSGGLGGLIIMIKNMVSKIYANEIDPQRAEGLESLGFETTTYDASQINNLLPDEIKPTFVMMNPPFSSHLGIDQRRMTFGYRHILQALARLEDGGRLVAILGEGVAWGKPKAMEFWREHFLGDGNYILRANIGLSGQQFKKYGTGFGVQLVVIDKKLNPNKKQVPVPSMEMLGEFDNISDAIAFIENKIPGRLPITKPEVKIDETKQRKPSILFTPGGKLPEKPTGSAPTAPTLTGTKKQEYTPAPKVDHKPEDVKKLDLETGEQEGLERKEVSGYVSYVPQKLKTGKKHPGNIVESASMAAVEPPDITYQPLLPKELIETGALSNIQLEAVIYAGQRHSIHLPNGNRAGFFLGDGTGIGKGREISAIILDNWNQGRKRAVWVSVSHDLIEDAKRDMKDINAAHIPTVFLGEWNMGEAISLPEGVIFTTYSTLTSGYTMGYDKSRLKTLVDWLNDDSVIVFDEAHKQKNLFSGLRGDPTQTGLVCWDLQEKYKPDSRVVYSSATGATDVQDIAYATRLGLWGEGAPFHDYMNFLEYIGTGGLGALEMLAREMKAMGSYVARRISYEDVTYEQALHELTPEQKEMYNISAEMWRIVFENMNNVISEVLGAEKKGTFSRSLTAYWGMHQRFYKSFITALKVPTAIKLIEEALADNKSVVLSIRGTNESHVKDAVNKTVALGGDLSEVDVTPREMLAQFLMRSFPVHTVEKKQTEQGKIIEVVNPNIPDKVALARRQELIDKLSAINLPENPLDQIINYFELLSYQRNDPSLRVAEITGRDKRLIKEIKKNPATGRFEYTGAVKYGKRAAKGVASTQKNVHEMQEFQSGRKRVAIISRAGATGISLHSDLSAQNQQQRVHITLELDWSADQQMQDFGRTHRSHQAVAPILKLLGSNVAGEKRFLATIAARLSSMNALTQGKRDAAGAGAIAQYDFDNEYGTAAIKDLYFNLRMRRIQGLKNDPRRILEMMNIVDEYGNISKSKDGDLKTFLNRILILDFDDQTTLFNAFEYLFNKNVETAKEKGTFETGYQTIKGLSTKKISETTVHTDKKMGTTTKYVEVSVEVPTPKMKFNEAHKHYLQKTSKKVYGLSFTFDKTNPLTGVVDKAYSLFNPGGHRYDKLKAEFDEKYELLDSDEAKKIWEEEYAKLPDTTHREFHLITGSILPFWQTIDKTIGKGLKVYRFETEVGENIIGLNIPESDIGTALRIFKVKKEVSDPKAIFESILKRGMTIPLINKLELKKSKLAGADIIELVSAGDNRLYEHKMFDELRKMGLLNESRDYVQRFYIPADRDIGLPVLEKLLKAYPVFYKEEAPVGGDTAPTGYASVDPISSNIYPKMPNPKELVGIEMPEMVELARELMGKIPTVRPMGKLGIARLGLNHQEILLNPLLFTGANVKTGQHVGTLAHEIGHFIDYLPDKDIKGRSTLIEKLLVLKQIRQHILPWDDMPPEELRELLKERTKLMNKLRRAKKRNEEGRETKVDVNQVEADLLEINNKLLIDRELRDELWELSKEWRPLGKSKTQRYMEYRKSAAELYADFISVLLNRPELAEQMAPKTFNRFFTYLDRKPEFRDKFFELMDFLGKNTREEILAIRQLNIEKMYQKGEDLFKLKREIQKNREKMNVMTQIRELFQDDLIRLRKREDKLGIPQHEKISLDMDEYHNYDFVIKEKMRGFKHIWDKMTSFGLTKKDLDSFLMVLKNMTTTADLARPLGFQFNESDAQLQHLRKVMGEESYLNMMNIVQEIQDWWHEEIIVYADENDLLTDKMFRTLEENREMGYVYYPTFVQDYFLKNHVPASLIKAIGTLKEEMPGSTMLLLKGVAILKAAKQNKIKLDASRKIFAQDGSSEKAKIPYVLTSEGIPQPKFPEREKNGMKLLAYKERGIWKGYYVDPYIYDCFVKSPAPLNDFLVRLLSKPNSVLKAIFTSYNPGFQFVFNPVRDSLRTYRNVSFKGKSISLWQLLRGRLKMFKYARRRAFGIEDPYVKEMEEAQVLFGHYSDFLVQLGAVNLDLESLSSAEQFFVKYGLVKAPIKENTFNKVMKPVMFILNQIRNYGLIEESLEKMVTYDYLKDEVGEGKIFHNKKELSDWIRRNIGTPYWVRKGKYGGSLNSTLLFSNITIQAWVEDLKAMSDPKTRAGVRWKIFKSSILPKLLMFLAASGLLLKFLRDYLDIEDDSQAAEFVRWLEESYSMISEFDKANYYVVPLGRYNHKAVYLRLPMSHTDRLLGGIFWKMLNMSGRPSSQALKSLSGVLDYSAGQMPTLTPVINVPVKWLQLAAGDIPKDDFRGIDLLIRDQAEVGGWKAIDPMLKWTLSQIGYRQYFDVREPDELERILRRIPVLNRILKISDWGLTDFYKDNPDLVEQKRLEAFNRIKSQEFQDKYVDQYFKEFKKLKEDGMVDGDLMPGIIVSNLQSLIQDLGNEDLIEIDRATLTRVSRRFIYNVLLRKEHKLYHHLRAIEKATTNEQKLISMNQLIDKKWLAGDEYFDYVRLLYSGGFINKDITRTILNRLKSDGLAPVGGEILDSNESTQRAARQPHDLFKID